jgi:hypothetical protein
MSFATASSHDRVPINVPVDVEAHIPFKPRVVTGLEQPGKTSAAVKASQGDGDLIVIQTGEPKAADLRSRALLRILGLPQDPVQLRSSGSSLVRRSLGTVKRYVEVITLALPVEPEAADTLRSAGIQMTESSYETSGGEALQFDFGDGERLNIEPREDSYSIAWTTALPLATLISRLEEFVPDDKPGNLTLFAGDEYRTLSDAFGRKLLDAILQTPTLPAFWRLDMDDMTVAWESHPESPIPGQPGLLGVIAGEFNPDYAQKLLEHTATPLIGAQAPPIVARCAETARRHRPLAAG